jgi:hypothetical protein
VDYSGVGRTRGRISVCWDLGGISRYFSITPKRIQPNSENIEVCVHSWLNNHRFAIKNDTTSDSYFRYRITFDNGKQMVVARMRDESKDYVQILADLGFRGDNKKLLEEFTQEEVDQLFWDTRVELARAQVGYGGLDNPPDNFYISRRVPIHHNLTEFAFMSMVGSVEAAMNLVLLMYQKTKAGAEKRNAVTETVDKS